MKSKFTFVDLFAGIGGFHHALAPIGGRCVLACEFDKDARLTYEANFPNKNGKSYQFIENIRSITRNVIDDSCALRSSEEINRLVPDHDLICGGFPCQPFSKSGGQLGVADAARGTLFYDILQIVAAKKPKYIFLENVRNISGPRHESTWRTVVSSLNHLGYSVPSSPMIFSPHLLPRKQGGAPQVRERVFIFGVRKDLDCSALKDLEQFCNNLRKKMYWNPDDWDISDFLDSDDQIFDVERYSVSDDELIYLDAWNYFVKNIELEVLPGFPIWAFALNDSAEINLEMPNWERSFRLKNSALYKSQKKFISHWLKMRWGDSGITVLEFPASRMKFEWQASKRHPRKAGRMLDDLLIQFRPSGIRVKAPSYVPALVAINQTSVVGPQLRDASFVSYRKLTPKEAARLQSLPESFASKQIVTDGVLYKQLGNAVNVGIVRESARLLLGLSAATIK